MYSIHYDGDSIWAFNLQQLTYESLDTTIPIGVSNFGCLASSATEKRLYFPGGYNWDNGGESLNDVQVLDLETTLWLDNVPSMTYNRHRHGCIVVEGELYVMGYVAEVEMIEIVDIESKSWYTLNDSVIPNGLQYFGIAEVGGIIFIVGGMRSMTYIDDIYTIDTVSKTTSVSADTLPYSLGYMALVYAKGIIYGFGGTSDGTVHRADWVSYVVPTSDPTEDPTGDPTADPSTNPTADPTVEPSQEPTRHPTTFPTVEPSAVPTANPTADPTSDPTKDPTERPTGTPIDVTTTAPTTIPTVYPTTNSEIASSSSANNITLTLILLILLAGCGVCVCGLSVLVLLLYKRRSGDKVKKHPSILSSKSTKTVSMTDLMDHNQPEGLRASSIFVQKEGHSGNGQGAENIGTDHGATSDMVTQGAV